MKENNGHKHAASVLSWLNLILWSFVTAWLWQWFIVPLGMIPIGYLHAIGITMTLRFIINTSDYRVVIFWQKQPNELRFKATLWSTFNALFALAFGFLINILRTIQVTW